VRSLAARLVIAAVGVGALVLSAALLREPPEPYVVTAIDYHFHDAHPTLPIEPGRDLVVKNAGRNVHNVTLDALELDEDIAPGSELTIEDVAGRLGPGRYTFFCRFHLDRGMTGVVVTVDG
jgi:plastocyanin